MDVLLTGIDVQALQGVLGHGVAGHHAAHSHAHRKLGLLLHEDAILGLLQTADCGDNVIIINAGKAVLTGNKGTQKIYRTHSGWVGGLKETPYRILMQEKPDVAMRVAVKGMMPKNTIARDAMKRLHIYADANYEQQAQKPVVLD